MPRESVLSFRAEFFNLTNTISFSAPNSSITSSSVLTTIDSAGGAQVTSTSVNPRDIQFALKYNF